MLAINVVSIHSLWLKRVRRSALALFVLAITIIVGMWLERYVIVLSSPAQDFLPSSWRVSFGNHNDLLMLLGSIAFFAVLLLIFIRLLPAITIYEVEELIHERRTEGKP